VLPAVKFSLLDLYTPGTVTAKTGWQAVAFVTPITETYKE
jgi:hypothetical protein